ncbi:MAG: DUF1902 domain-containing protein [Methylovulum sp.]|uniref:DUF1902 domain-containing protein n=1 Tax=Methylovulum sp. TaxID=1916980 RepID=UPI0026170B47|nr:DUF1902 domain-containing protein [Methylovulum sp.]MDD2722564.1 DUF1902 domain-containing protein [Methylovulum sp.]MDD5123092.1 DUF1902 domain-containing protein [Methylovulum sp.]
MNITIEIPDEMNDQLAGIKNINMFVLNTLKTALAAQAHQPVALFIPSDNVFVVDVSVLDGIWMAECDSLGLVTEAEGYDDLIARVWQIAPELTELNNLGVDADNLRLRFSHEQTTHPVTA